MEINYAKPPRREISCDLLRRFTYVVSRRRALVERAPISLNAPEKNASRGKRP